MAVAFTYKFTIGRGTENRWRGKVFESKNEIKINLQALTPHSPLTFLASPQGFTTTGAVYGNGCSVMCNQKEQMGIVGEFYRVEDEVIDYFIQHPKEASDYFQDNYNVVYGKFHNEPDRHFYTDKAWDIAIFLLKECDHTENKVISGIKGQLFDPKDWDTPSYLKSTQVNEIADALENITEQQLENALNVEKMKVQNVYRAEWGTKGNWEDYILIHTKELISAFSAAKRYTDGIVIYYC